jgi:hypothetical protein
MTHPKTDHKIRKSTSTTPPARPATAPTLATAPERQDSASTNMIEACDRLGQKLDEVSGLFREQIEAWRQIGPPTAHPAGRENALHRGVAAPAAERASSAQETPPAPTAPTGAMREQPQEQRRDDPATPAPAPMPHDGLGPEQRRDAAATPPSGGGAEAPQSGAPAHDGLAKMAEGAGGLADALSRSGRDWPEQADRVQQALEGIMAYLENQAATAPPKVDAAAILNRLKDLEEQQQNMQSQFNNSR